MDNAKVYQELRFELTRLATALVGASEAEDVVATVVARTLARPGGLAGLEDPRPYLARATLNEARSRHRRRGRQRPLVAEPADAPLVDHRDQIIDVVRLLPPQQRAAAFLVYWEGHTPTSAAEMMGCRPATVRRYLHLARKKLERLLDE